MSSRPSVNRRSPSGFLKQQSIDVL